MDVDVCSGSMGSVDTDVNVKGGGQVVKGCPDRQCPKVLTTKVDKDFFFLANQFFMMTVS